MEHHLVFCGNDTTFDASRCDKMQDSNCQSRECQVMHGYVDATRFTLSCAFHRQAPTPRHALLTCTHFTHALSGWKRKQAFSFLQCYRIISSCFIISITNGCKSTWSIPNSEEITLNALVHFDALRFQMPKAWHQLHGWWAANKPRKCPVECRKHHWRIL